MARSFVKTPAGVSFGFQVGQWVSVDGVAKKARFVKYNADGTAHLVYPTGRGKRAKVSMAAFRLACGKPMKDVLATSKVG